MGNGTRPVIDVSWNDAKQFSAWLTGKTGYQYRLPSEAEWEYAARAGTTTRYWFGDTIGKEQANHSGSIGKTTDVGAYPANLWHLHDLHGNVREWVEDVYHDSYEGAPSDGSAWISSESFARIRRGGSWSNDAKFLRSADRFGSLPDRRSSRVGFRVARMLHR